MKPYLFKLLPFFTALLFSLRPAAAQDSTALQRKQTKIQTEVFDFLNTKGYRPYMDEDDDLTFKEAGTRYWILFDEHGVETSTRVTFRSSWELPKKFKKNKLLATCNYLNLKLSVIKSYCDLNRNRIYFSVETWIQNSSDFTKLFTTYLVGLEAATASIFGEIE